MRGRGYFHFPLCVIRGNRSFLEQSIEGTLVEKSNSVCFIVKQPSISLCALTVLPTLTMLVQIYILVFGNLFRCVLKIPGMIIQCEWLKVDPS